MRGGERLDKALLARSLARSRTEAQGLISAGHVTVDDAVITKPSLLVEETTQIVIHGDRPAYVSRGGLKQASALDRFGIPVSGRDALDVGASTGGWTDCLLQKGIRHVLALDVGHGQMAPSVAGDARVESREGVNARFLTPTQFSTPFDLVVADLSFISLTLVLPAVAPLLALDGDMILLVKPQFEVGAGGLGKGGIVRNDAARQAALERIAEAARSCGLRETGRMDSPILGSGGNREYLLWLRAGTAATGVE